MKQAALRPLRVFTRSRARTSCTRRGRRARCAMPCPAAALRRENWRRSSTLWSWSIPLRQAPQTWATVCAKVLLWPAALTISARTSGRSRDQSGEWAACWDGGAGGWVPPEWLDVLRPLLALEGGGAGLRIRNPRAHSLPGPASVASRAVPSTADAAFGRASTASPRMCRPEALLARWLGWDSEARS